MFEYLAGSALYLLTDERCYYRPHTHAFQENGGHRVDVCDNGKLLMASNKYERVAPIPPVKFLAAVCYTN
jgi:hypothetical protein